MGIYCYGFIDKFSRKELSLTVAPNVRDSRIPVLLYLRLVKKLKGLPIQLVTDKGSETGPLAAMQTMLRQRYDPFLPIEEIPAHTFVKSVFNITRERAWRPLWENELGQIKVEWESGQIEAGYHPNDPLHEGIALWLWAKIAQERLDQHCYEVGVHKIKKQPKSRMPTGGRVNDFYYNPRKWGGREQKIEIPESELPFIDELIEKYSDPALFRFGSEETTSLAQSLFEEIGSPRVSAKDGWLIFSSMMGAHYGR